MSDVHEVEVWRNPGGSSIWVKVRSPHDPGKQIDVEIRPRQSVTINPIDRKYNQYNYAPGMDFFTNGSLEPVKLLETASDFEALIEEDGVRTESQLRDLLKLTAQKLKKELAEIDNLTILKRIQAIASEDDALAVGKSRAINERVDEIESAQKDDIFQIKSEDDRLLFVG